MKKKACFMAEVGFYNYYNIQGRYTPQTPKDTYSEWVEWANSDELKSLSEELNPYSEENLAIRKLDEQLAPMAEALRNKFSTVDEVESYLKEKYFGTPQTVYTIKWEEPEKYAMYENDLNAVLFGTIGQMSVNRDDPRLNFTERDWQEQEIADKTYRHDSISKNMANLLKNNGIQLEENDSLLISFNPYSSSVSVEGLEDLTLLKNISDLLNSGDNSNNLMMYALNTQTVNQEALTKWRAYQTLKEYTGLDLSELTLKNNEFYTSDGKKVLDVLKDKLDNYGKIAVEFKGVAYDYTAGLLKQVAQKGWNSMPDLEIFLGYSQKDGFFTFGNTYIVE